MRRLFLIFTVILLGLAVPLTVVAEEDGAVTKKGAKQAVSARKGTKQKKTAKGSVKKKSATPAQTSTQKKAGAKIPAEAAVVAPRPASLAQVTELRHWSTPDYTRVAVTLDREVPFEKHQIAQTPGGSAVSRLYFDIAGAKVGPGVKDLPIGDGLLKTARVGQYSGDTVRVVLDMENVKDTKVFTFADPYRIIVDVKGERPAELTRLEPGLQSLAAAVEVKREQPREPESKPTTPFKPGKVRRIVVDPGHGGKDPGAIGAGGLQEKDVVLSVGLMLARKIRDQLGIDVVMTRSSDIFIELQERTAIANQVGADLFVSVHANASLNRNASGIETYYLNLAKTEKAAQLAARENGTSLEKVSLLQAVLFDLMANYKLNDSAHLADEVQKTLHKKLSGGFAGVKNLGVKQGPFYVLVGATMPSILVETAFISNEREEARLRDPQYLESTADGILDGIRSYVTSLK
ncbi:MAG TPA: N-acetylmuramoyl-L-alanine amidase [Geobacteraceae bacterium]